MAEAAMEGLDEENIGYQILRSFFYIHFLKNLIELNRYICVMSPTLVTRCRRDWHFCRHCSGIITNIADACEHKCFIGSENIYTDDNGNLYVDSIDESNDDKVLDSPSSKNESEREAPNKISVQSNDHTKKASVKRGGSSKDSSENKNAVWTKNTTLALLELYEVNKDVLDNPKKKTKIWNIISQGLKEAEIEMMPEQVRWKFNRLQRKYKECVDNNRKSGRAHMTFEYFREMEEIFNVDKDIGDAETLSSKMASSKKKPISEISSLKSPISEISSLKSPVSEISSLRSPISQISSTSSQMTTKRRATDNLQKVPSTALALPTADPSTIPEKKVRKIEASRPEKKSDLENYYFDHLKKVEERQQMRDEKIDKYVKTKVESVQLRKKELETREKMIERNKIAEAKKQKSKQERHEELMEIERQKMYLLRKLLKEKNSDTE